MSAAQDWTLRGWLGLFGAARSYHRYEVIGIERLIRQDPVLIVGYHGRPSALDLCMLTVSLHERLGYLPHGIVHGALSKTPLLGEAFARLGFVTGDGPEVAAAVARGEHVLVQPGGTREGYRSFRRRYEVDWGERTGYLRLAIKHRLPIVPVGGSGMDDAFFGFNDGYALGKKLGMPAGVPLWLGLGATGVWPLSLPFPVKMTQRVGEPIEEHLAIDTSDAAALRAAHRRVMAAVQGLLGEQRGGAR
jgi:1-acyl-sn-glycerol-3-phosphate acyltransferase